MSGTRQFFGTDGVRGPYGGPVVNEAFFARLAFAAGCWTKEQSDFAKASGYVSGRPQNARPARGAGKILIGRDTRVSGEGLVRAVWAGLHTVGLEPVDLGVLPTPAVALAMKAARAALGVVVTASHNSAGDNGIKFFKWGGLKLSDEEEMRIEALLPNDSDWEKHEATIAVAGNFPAKEGMLDAVLAYIETVRHLMPAEALRGWHIVLDMAEGATGVTSQSVLKALGAVLVRIGANMSGADINAGCGSEHPEKMCAAVRAHGARLGIAHDGDGDRCVLCDEHGDVLDGDEVLVILALHALRAGRLGADTLVVTVQSNLGVDAALAAAGGRVVRTPVGDRHVAEKMRELGATLGGESSGHIICADVSPTGDGLLAALRVMEVMRATGRPLSELRRWLRKFPQASTTVAIATGAAKPPLDALPALAVAIRALEAELGARGRVLARWSGTEPKLRLLVEGPDEATVRDGLARLAAAARRDLV
jgi:phosphoglucosamine mutase